MPPTTTYTLTRVFDGDDDMPYMSTSFTTNEFAHLNAAHMIAAGFNTMSRNFLDGAALAVVYADGRVQFDGRAEQLAKADPEMSVLFDDERGKLLFPSNLKLKTEKPSEYAHVAREVLEAAYADQMTIREALSEAGAETIPPSAGVADLIERRESARSEMISFVKRAHVKKDRLTVGDVRPDLEDRWRGMLDVLAKFLVVTGEADADEGHAVARRLCGIGVDGDE
jgi:hypothetical protein